ncbi:hypothetical protein BAUCODRAFT_79464 [Baudoinia panamericana UAMH 10762]|uniref:HTH APSES-type domain-containing protein n=1 Tax=Baudoinia panamericana (strain UAMH 10762) TaxID=717646 RepID=M2M5Q1_BAUPA|nr:uncharacterized protein BAUCODRAFT_79464 [Baudoinia panamericana UAMH 10762]EMC91961.1 hypothetical protein BAUCODRAFT_79464 [Baudoinia panamericana UAMH 10762]
MATTRELPKRRNALVSEDSAPPYEILVERRCLGQTELRVKPGQVGLTNATKADHLGTLDYAHLRVPLPRDLTGSGIFTKSRGTKWPEAYFLMRRSSDGFVSATGMFKAAFPFAQHDEEMEEKEYIKSLGKAASEEVAGNVWIHPDQALDLADEYGIRLWVEALLDPEPITHGTSPGKDIQSPPAYRVSDMTNGDTKSPEKKSSAAEGRKSTRGRRSASVLSEDADALAKTPSRPKATPRKPRGGKGGRGTLSKVDEDEIAPVNGADAAESKESVRETVKVQVETTVDPEDDEVEHTKVNVELPIGHPDMPLPDDPLEMVEQARRIVEDAQKLNGVSTGKGKRKAAEMTDADDESERPLPPKRARMIEIELRKERIARRALTGIAGLLAIG